MIRGIAQAPAIISAQHNRGVSGSSTCWDRLTSRTQDFFFFFKGGLAKCKDLGGIKFTNLEAGVNSRWEKSGRGRGKKKPSGFA